MTCRAKGPVDRIKWPRFLKLRKSTLFHCGSCCDLFYPARLIPMLQKTETRKFEWQGRSNMAPFSFSKMSSSIIFSSSSSFLSLLVDKSPSGFTRYKYKHQDRRKLYRNVQKCPWMSLNDSECPRISLNPLKWPQISQIFMNPSK